MKRSKWMTMAGVGVGMALSLIAFRPYFAQATAAAVRTTWEYRIVEGADLSELGGGKWEAGLNRLGAEGWELIGVDPMIPRPSSVAAKDKNSQAPLYSVKPSIFFFKR